MNHLPLSPDAGGRRYPGLDVMAQSRHWDAATMGVVAPRVGMPPDIRFFTRDEVATAAALCDRLLDQGEDPQVPVVALVDARLAEDQTDGWRYADMPHDSQAWRDSLAGLDADAREEYGLRFHELRLDEQDGVLRHIQHLSGENWRGMPAGHVWSLWIRYACTAFYSHPWAWAEIGFTGPAYPRGYKNLGIGTREPFEVADARPDLDPTKAPAGGDDTRGRGNS